MTTMFQRAATRVSEVVKDPSNREAVKVGLMGGAACLLGAAGVLAYRIFG